MQILYEKRKLEKLEWKLTTNRKKVEVLKLLKTERNVG